MKPGTPSGKSGSGQEQEISASINKVLEQQVDSLDDSVQQRLFEARREAMQATHANANKRRFVLPVWSTLAVSGALSVFVALIMWPQFDVSKPPLERVAEVDALDELLWLSEIDDESLELVEELEFAYWLSQELDGEMDELERDGAFLGKPESTAVGASRNG